MRRALFAAVLAVPLACVFSVKVEGMPESIRLVPSIPLPGAPSDAGVADASDAELDGADD